MATYIGTHNYTGATVTGIAGVTPTFDAVVASTGGDYTTLGAAITAGKKSIFVANGTVTETGAVTLPANCLIFGESMYGAKINMAGYLLTTADSTTIFNCAISNNLDGNQIVIGGDFNTISSCFIENLRSTNPTAQMGVITDANVARARCHLIDLRFDVIPAGTNMGNLTTIWIQNAGSDAWKVHNITLGGSAGFHSKHLYCAASECCISNFLVWNVGTAGNSSVQISGNYNTITNLQLKGSTSRIEISGNFNTLSGYVADNASNIIYISGDGNVFSGISTLGSISNIAGGDHNMIGGSRIDAGVTIAGNDNTIAGSSVGALAGGGANTITVSSGATRTIISDCRVDAAVSNGGTGTVASYEVF